MILFLLYRQGKLGENNVRSIVKETAGFTLIELMVTLALVGVVIAGGFSLYFFADRSFVSGTVVADVQADIQLAMQRMTNELRLAHKIEFIDTPEIPLENDHHYLFINDAGLVVLRTKRGSGFFDEILTPMNPDIANYDLTFSDVDEVPNTLKIELKSLIDGAPYSLESEIQVLNIRGDGLQANSESEGLYFTKTLSIAEREDAKLIRRRCVLLFVIFKDQDPELNVFRRFRDDKLQNTKLGKLFVKKYYDISPYLADLLEQQPYTQVILKNGLRIIAKILSIQDLLIKIFFGSLSVILFIGTTRKFRAFQQV